MAAFLSFEEIKLAPYQKILLYCKYLLLNSKPERYTRAR